MDHFDIHLKEADQISGRYLSQLSAMDCHQIEHLQDTYLALALEIADGTYLLISGTELGRCYGLWHIQLGLPPKYHWKYRCQFPHLGNHWQLDLVETLTVRYRLEERARLTKIRLGLQEGSSPIGLK